MDPTDIPADAQTAEQHAAPPDLTNPPTQATPTPHQPQNGTGPQTEQEYYDTPDDRPAQEYDSPEPVEAIFAQIRDDMRRNERLLMLTATTVVFMGLLFAYYVRKGGLEVGE